MAARNLSTLLTGVPPTMALGDGLHALSSRAPAAHGLTADGPADDDLTPRFEAVEAALAQDPDGVAGAFRDAFGSAATPEELAEILARGRLAASDDHAAAQPVLPGPPLDIRSTFGSLSLGIHADFSARYIADHVPERYWRDQPPIDLEPRLTRFQDDDFLGLLGWLLFNGPEALRVPRSLAPPFRELFGRIPNAADFRRHGVEDAFVYALDVPADRAARVALFADFGTGLGHARFIARQLAVDGYDAAIHLGDVYYTGTRKEYPRHFASLLEPARASGTKLFVIPDNHDGYSGFHAYGEYLDYLAGQQQPVQRGSYFALRTPHVQFIAVDTIWHSERGRIRDGQVRDWLAHRLAEGRERNLTNVLLTGHHPYTYEERSSEPLLADVLELGQEAIDFWFWGNTHYGALFEPHEGRPFFGSCVGHAGYPFKRMEGPGRRRAGKPSVLWVETGSRFAPTKVRHDRGMNGFCRFEIETDGGLALRYLDWRGQERHVARFAQRQDGRVELLAEG